MAWLPLRQRAVVSHESALALHGLSDVIPASVHLTVGRAARGVRPSRQVTLHTTTREPTGADVVEREGIAVTAPARSIVDAANAGTAPEQIELAVAQALAAGLTTPSQLRRQAAGAGRRTRALIERALGS
jgi:predicted transcriptional regulator of viral defense system